MGRARVDATTSVRTTLRDRARMATSRVARATLDVRGYAADGSAHRVSARASFEYAYETREDDANATVRVMLTPSDGRATFARYACALTRERFETMRREQSLTLRTARECAETCGRALEKAARGEGLAVLACDAKSGKARLEIVEEYANRLVSVMEMEFEMMDDVEVRARVSEEYGRMKRTLAAYEAKFGRLEA
jgi:hypothetical protein